MTKLFQTIKQAKLLLKISQSLVRNAQTPPQKPEDKKSEVQKPEAQKPEAQKPSKSEDKSKHKIAAGDTLAEIAQKYYGKADLWPIIASANNISMQETRKLQIGREIIIPEKRSLNGEEISLNKRFFPDYQVQAQLLKNPEGIKSFALDLELVDLGKISGIAIKHMNSRYAHPKIAEAIKELLSKNIPVRITEAFPNTGMHQSATHRNGSAIDFTIGEPNNPQAPLLAPRVVEFLKSKGLRVINEYSGTQGSRVTTYRTGNHIHVSV